jgi:hypothetical protein
VTRHVAVVAVGAVDAHTAGALEYASSLAPRVIALHVCASAVDTAFEQQWADRELQLPLVVLAAPDGDHTGAMRRALAVLRRTEQPDQITVVIPWARGGGSLSPDDLFHNPADASVRVQYAPAAL